MEDQQYVCEPCKKSFTSNEKLVKHQKDCDKAKLAKAQVLLHRRVEEIESLKENTAKLVQELRDKEILLQETKVKLSKCTEAYIENMHELKVKYARLEGQVRVYRTTLKKHAPDFGLSDDSDDTDDEDTDED